MRAHVEWLLAAAVQELNKKKEVASNTITALTSELRTTKLAFDELAQREQQVEGEGRYWGVGQILWGGAAGAGGRAGTRGEGQVLGGEEIFLTLLQC